MMEANALAMIRLMRTVRTPVQKKSTWGQQKRQWERPQYRYPDDIVATDFVTDDTAEQYARGGGCEENEQHQLRSRDRNAESIDEI
jgi:hypothetical protein